MTDFCLNSMLNKNMQYQIVEFWQKIISYDQQIHQLETDLFSILDTIKFNLEKQISIDNSWMKCLEIMFSLIVFVRDIDQGLGQRQLTYMMLYVWYKQYPILAVYALEILVTVQDGNNMSYGSWRDIPGLCQYIYNRCGDHPFITTAIEMMNKQLYRDWIIFQEHFFQEQTIFQEENYKVSESAFLKMGISNACKWIPRENSQFKWLFQPMVLNWSWTHTPYILRSAQSSTQYARAINKCSQHYRRMVSKMTLVLDPIECKQCANQEDQINIANITTNALAKYWSLSKISDLYTDNQIDTLQKDNLENSDNSEINYLINSSTYGKYVQYAIQYLNTNDCKNDDITKLNQRWAYISKKWIKKHSKMMVKMVNCLPIIHIQNIQSIHDPKLYSAIAQACLISEYSNLGHRILFAGNQPIWINLGQCNGFVSYIQTIFDTIQGNGLYNILCPNLELAFSTIRLGLQMNDVNIQVVVLDNSIIHMPKSVIDPVIVQDNTITHDNITHSFDNICKILSQSRYTYVANRFALITQ